MEHCHQSNRPSSEHRRGTGNDQRSVHKHRNRRSDILAQVPSNVSQIVLDHLENPLSGDHDYVRRWLAQTDDRENGKINTETITTRAVDDKLSTYTNSSTQLRIGIDYNTKQVLQSRKRRHGSSSDSSILEALTMPRPPFGEFDNTKHSTNNIKTQKQDTRNTRRRIETVESEKSKPPSSPPKEIFEKRPRHKTREDRYEPKNASSSKEGIADKRPTKKKASKPDKKKVTKRAGEDLMRNFTSKSIGQDRLTIRPSQGLGLFKNGRASSPARRRGIPDLAFSEMEFLQHSWRQGPLEQLSNAKSRSKSREKERKKSQRAHEEIAEFFQPKRGALQEIKTNNKDPLFSKYRQEESSVYNWQGEPNNRHDGFARRSPHESPHQFTKAGLYARNEHRFDDQRSLSHDVLDAANERPTATLSEQIEPATSFLSWSESQKTPLPRSNSKENSKQRSCSPTPDHVRLSIERTGIFKDTRFYREGVGTFNHTCNTGNLGIRHGDISGIEIISNHRSKSVLGTPTTRSSVYLPRHSTIHLSDSDNNTPISDRRPIIKILQPRVPVALENTSLNGCTHAVLRYDKPDTERKQVPNHKTSPATTHPNRPRNGELTPAYRAQLARNARIRRPSSSLPATRENSDVLGNIQANRKYSPTAPALSDKAANSGVELQDNVEVGTDTNEASGEIEPVTQSREVLVEEIALGPIAASSRTLGKLGDGSSTNINSSAKFLNLVALEESLQTPALIHSAAIHGLGKTECISHLGLPFRGPSRNNNNRGPSPNMLSSRLAPITEPDPLFLRQLNEENRGDFRLNATHPYLQQSTTRFEKEVPNSVEAYHDHLLYRDGQMTEDNVADCQHLGDSANGQCAREIYLTHTNDQQLTAQKYEQPTIRRLWHPSLTPIREQSNESEQGYLDEDAWAQRDEPHVDHELYDCELHPQQRGDYLLSDLHGRYQEYQIGRVEDINEIEGFWRPHFHY